MAQLYLDPLNEALRQAGFDVVPILVPDGEEHKNLESLATIYDRLIAERLERKSCIARAWRRCHRRSGGICRGDLPARGSLCAGADHVARPGRFERRRQDRGQSRRRQNLIGAFYQPNLVLIDIACLALAAEARIGRRACGGDQIRHHRRRRAVFLLEESIDQIIGLNSELLTQIIATSCAIKARVVEADEREDDYRAVLNFGHTIGHALEAATGYREFLHGEAVGVGMVKAAALSVSQRFCDAASLKRMRRWLKKPGLPLEIPPEVAPQSLIQAMEIDKKVAGGKIKFVMCEGIGKTRFHWLAPSEILARVWALRRAFCGGSAEEVVWQQKKFWCSTAPT